MVQTIVQLFDPNANQPPETLPFIDMKAPYISRPGSGTWEGAVLRADDAFHFVRINLNPVQDVPGFAWLRTLFGIVVWVSFIFFAFRIMIPKFTF